MALIKCPECGNKVSEYAATCPHCGGPIAFSKIRGSTPIHTAINVLTLLVLGLVLLLLVYRGIWMPLAH